MTRVREFDVLECPRCGARIRIPAVINPPEVIHQILDCLGLPTRSPPIAPGACSENKATTGNVGVGVGIGIGIEGHMIPIPTPNVFMCSGGPQARVLLLLYLLIGRLLICSAYQRCP